MLEQLQPNKVFYYFEELTKIPHGSGNTKAVSDYCVSFAREHNLTCYQDELNNVVIVKEASEGREKDPGVIIQGHLDMVTVKDAGSSIDFLKDPLDVQIDGDWIYAKGTSLGGDDGIAVAYGLALLEAEDISHPRLEVIFTADEEVGMLGAADLDMSMIQGKYLLNLDSEEEGILLSGCAGGLRGDIELPVQYEEGMGKEYELCLKGMKGGHSGAEIQKERANAIKLAGRLLHTLCGELEIGVFDLQGGEKDNAIPRDFTIKFLAGEQEEEALFSLIAREQETYQREYEISDGGIRIEMIGKGTARKQILTPMHQEKIIFLLMNLPNGIQHMSMDIPGLVETSLNAGICKLTEDSFSLTVSIRSSVKSRKYEVSARLNYLTEFLGGEYRVYGDYPEWTYNRESRLRMLMMEIYEEMFGKKPEIQAIHAGLECGMLLQKCPGLDVISFGPDMADIHTPKETLSISSVKRMWEYLLEILKRIS